MGDIPPHVGSEEYPNQDLQQSSSSQYIQNQHAFASQLDMTMHHPSGNGQPGAFNMASMASSLPQQPGGFRPGGGYAPPAQQHRYVPHNSSPMMPHMAGHYSSQGGMPMTNHQQYYMPQHPQGQPFYGSPISPAQHQSRPNMGFYPNQMMMGNQQPNHIGPGYYYQHPGTPSYPQHQQGMAQPIPGQYYGHGMPVPDTKALPQSPTVDDSLGHFTPGARDMPDGKSRVVRGPPRKPKQSGHAIWIGNLPPQTDLMSLVHHVCKEAPGLESLFLISKSNCAFANFKDEATCVAAQQKLHDSKFQSVRLVSRLRKSTVEGAAGITAPTGPAASVETPGSQDKASDADTGDAASEQPPTPVTRGAQPGMDADASTQQDRFFILKSLTVEDLELSIKTGIWATQSHNEEALNKAFNAVDNVYLVFSANKSGEYFGYARMVSPINEDPDAAIEFAPKVQTNNDMDLPKAIPTEATEFAPKGRIIDDSARGTIFWEAESEEAESADEEEESDTSSIKAGEAADDGTTKAWGKPFKLEWLSTARLPFYRTRGLRNPWNSNREVKIARDGTELEPSVGRRLIGLFNRVQSPIPGSLAPGMRTTMIAPGFAPMRPY